MSRGVGGVIQHKRYQLLQRLLCYYTTYASGVHRMIFSETSDDEMT